MFDAYNHLYCSKNYIKYSNTHEHFIIKSFTKENEYHHVYIGEDGLSCDCWDFIKSTRPRKHLYLILLHVNSFIKFSSSTDEKCPFKLVRDYCIYYNINLELNRVDILPHFIPNKVSFYLAQSFSYKKKYNNSDNQQKESSNEAETEIEEADTETLSESAPSPPRNDTCEKESQENNDSNDRANDNSEYESENNLFKRINDSMILGKRRRCDQKYRKKNIVFSIC